jgi:small subunit ribosomal protein S6
VLRDYEILFVVRPDLDEDQVAAATKSVDTLIEGLGGKTKKTDAWGRRKLAYEVKHLREGHYILTDFELETERVPELEGTLKISETVFRYLVVRKPEKSGKVKKAEGAAKAEEAAKAQAEEAARAEAAAATAEPEPAEVSASADAEAPAETVVAEPETQPAR